MLKKILLVCAIVFSMTGCSENSSSVSSVEISESQKECEQLIETLGISNMTRVKDRVVLGMIFGGDQSVIDDACMYRSSEEGNYDMIGVFFTSDMEQCKSYVDDYLLTIKDESNINYPQEVFKISNAIEKHNDEKLVLIICDDIEAAREQVVAMLDSE